MELRHLHYFVAVAEELHFGNAAKRLNMTQPPLSQQIKALEDELGVCLFDRNRRHVELTEAGRAFLPEARFTLEQAERAATIARQTGAGLRGALSVGFVTSASTSILPAIIQRFCLENPGIDLQLAEMIPAEQLAALDRKTMHVGLLRPPISSACWGLESILHEPLVAALPVAHRLASRRKLDLAELRDEAFVLFPRSHGPGIFDVILKTCQEAGFFPEISYQPNQMQALLAYVAGGLGVSLVPGSVQDFHRDRVRYIPLSAPRKCIELSLIWRQDTESGIRDTFCEIARQEAKAYQALLYRALQA